MNLFDLSGKVAVITDSSRGIGRAIAEAMAFRRRGDVERRHADLRQPFLDSRRDKFAAVIEPNIGRQVGCPRSSEYRVLRGAETRLRQRLAPSLADCAVGCGAGVIRVSSTD